MKLYRIYYSIGDGGSVWFVRAKSANDAKALVKLYFTERNPDWNRNGSFRASVANDSYGHVFRGGS